MIHPVANDLLEKTDAAIELMLSGVDEAWIGVRRVTKTDLLHLYEQRRMLKSHIETGSDPARKSIVQLADEARKRRFEHQMLRNQSAFRRILNFVYMLCKRSN